MKETEITIKVKLDDNNIPEQISWSAPDGGMIDESSKAMLLSFWDSKKKETLKMDPVSYTHLTLPTILLV